MPSSGTIRLILISAVATLLWTSASISAVSAQNTEKASEEGKPLWKARVQKAPPATVSDATSGANPTTKTPTEVIRLNNEGVKALNSGNYALGISKFKEALQIKPSYRLARHNLAITHNNLGMSIHTRPEEAVNEFRESLYLYPSNETTQGNLDVIIKMLGKDPLDYITRRQFGDEQRLAKNYHAAVAEYVISLRLKDDPETQRKLSEVYDLLNVPAKERWTR